MDEPHKHYAKGRKPKQRRLPDCMILVTCNFWTGEIYGTEQCDCLGLAVRAGTNAKENMRRTSIKADGNFLKLDCGGSEHYEFTKI